MTIRTPDPKANTTTEAYLAYKAGYLEENELKPVLYEPYLHFDAWLAYWAGLTNEYPLDKNGDPEMLTDEEALVAYLAGVTDTYPEEIKDPYDVRIVGYLKHLVSVRWPEPDYPVNNEEFYLSTMEPTHTSNPVPSSNIELDTAEGKIIDVKAYGDTYQQTYSGKNLLPFTNQDFTLKGIHYYVQEGSLYRDGTSSGETYANNATWKDNFSFTLPAGTYTFSYSGETSIVSNMMKASDNTKITNDLTTSVRTRTFTLTEQTEVYLGFYVYNTSRDNEKVLLQLELGSTATSYEPYVGGIPAPSPSYPMPISVVTGEQNVLVHGKNLFDWASLNNKSSEVYNASNVEVTDTGIIATGNTSSGTDYASSRGSYQPARANVNSQYRVNIAANSTATISADITLLESNYNPSTKIYLDGDTFYDSQPISLTLNQKIRVSRTFTNVSAGDYRPTFMLNSNRLKIENIQLELGSTATAYQPYQSQSYEIDLTGKNLFDCPSTANTTPNTVFTKIDSNSFRTEFTKTTSTMQSSFTQIQLLGLLPNTTYTISCSSEVTGDNYNRAGQFRMHIGSNWSNYYSGSATFTTPSDVSSVYFAPANAQDVTEPGSNSVVFSNVQLELGSTVTPYAPYFTPIELCKIGDYQDYIYKSGDDWYVHKDCTHYAFTGDEDWQLRNTQESGISTFSWNFSGYKFEQGACNNALCNYYTNLGSVYSVATMYTKGIGFSLYYYIGYIGRVLYINTMDANLPTFKTNILGKLFYYALATPTDTKITDATLISQLEALAGADTYNEKTFIRVTTNDPNLPALLKVEAYKY